MNRTYPIIFIILAITSIQFGASKAKGLFPIIGAPSTAVLRLIIASFILLLIWRPWRMRFSKQTYKAIALYGISLGFMNLLFYLALEKIPLGIAVALEFTGPLGVTLAHSRRKLDFLWAILASIGIFLLLPIYSYSSALDMLGIAYALSAGFCWAMYILYGQKAGENEHSGIITSMGMFVAALVVLPFGFYYSDFSTFDKSIYPIAILVAIFSSALPYSLEMIALKKLPTKTFGILMSLEPAVAAIMGVIFLKEVLSAKELMAIAFIISASIGGSIRPEKDMT